MLERNFKVRVQDFIAELRKETGMVWAVKIQQVAISGTPDMLLCVRGVFVALELKKSASASITALQRHNLEKINKARGKGLVVYPENWEEIKLQLTAIAKGLYD